MKLRFVVPLILCAVAAVAAEPQTVVLHARHLLDIHTGSVSDAFIVVRGDRIAAVERSAPAGAKIVDLGDATVLPGFIDCHVHLTADWSDFSATGPLRMSSGAKALLGLKYAQEYLGLGFTTVRDVGSVDPYFADVAVRDAIAHGMYDGPRVFVSGMPISITGGHADLNPLAPDVPIATFPNIADSPDGVRAAVRHNIKYGVDWIKLMATGGVSDVLSDFTVQELSDEQLAAAVETAHRAHRKVCAHAEGTAGIAAAVRAGVDSIEHGTMLDDATATEMARRGTFLVPTLETFQRGVEIGLTQGQEPLMLEKGKTILKYQRPAFENALKHHVKIAFGLDDEPKYVTREFQTLVRFGLTPLQALQAATMSAAELLGVDAGAIEPGRTADIIAVNGDPLKDIGATANVVFVMRGGKIVTR